MHSRTVLLCALILGGCASQPGAPVAFHAPVLTAGPAVTSSDWQPLDFEGVAPSEAGSATRPVSRQDEGLDGPLDEQTLTVLLGQREIDDDDLETLDLDEQMMVGIEYEAHDRGTGDGFELGTSFSREDDHFAGQDTEAQLLDIYGGYRKTFLQEEDEVRPYVALGAALVRGDVDIGPQDDDDSTLGAYLRFGVNFDVGDELRLGLDYRHLFANLDLFGENFDADYDQFAVTLGFPF